MNWYDLLVSNGHQETRPQRAYSHRSRGARTPRLRGRRGDGQKREKENLEEDPPPDISQNHYRHIHEQRDFTLENLSMAGETEILDYDDYKVMLEFDWQLDSEL